MNKLRKANLDDLNDLVEIIDGAKTLLKQEGLSQWQSGTPNKKTLKDDILNKSAYVYEVDGKIAATINLSTKKDPNYQHIDGIWQNEQAPYVSVHRLAIHRLYRNEKLGQALLNEAIQWALDHSINQLRIDTHRHNVRMLYLIQKYRFEFAGVVEVDDPIDAKRNAYQLFISTL